MVNLSRGTKFEVSIYTRYEDKRGGEKNGMVWVVEVTQGHRKYHHSTERIRLPIRL